MSNDIVIRTEHLNKSFRYYRSNRQKIRNLLLGRDSGELIKVLNDVSFEIRKGEKVAIFGIKRSGKTTLMRILSGIIEQDSGIVEVNGEVTSVLSLRLGFQKTMNGRDNYVMRGKIMGWTNEQIKENEQEVFEYAELTGYRDELFKTYPAGGPGRLGFAMSTIYTTGIYLFDDRFTLGEKRHVLRGIRRLRELIAGDDITFVMTAVNATVAKRLCERGLVMYDGTIVFDGPLEEAYAFYKDNYVSTGKKKAPVRDPDDSSDEDMDESPDDDDDGFTD